MKYTSAYQSPMGGILLAADDRGLTGLWFNGAKYYAHGLEAGHKERDLPVFRRAAKWLDLYFSGREPDFTLPVHMIGSPFQLMVWEILGQIPYGQVTTYGRLAGIIARKRGLPSMSAQAVGGAAGHNKISVIIPCHRIVGADGSLTGYAGGLDRKAELLALEGADIKRDCWDIS